MAIEAPISKFKRNNLIIYIVVLVAVTAWCVYDGYLNKNFIEKHTDSEGNPDASLIFSKYAPPFAGAGALLLAVYWSAIRNKKLIADEQKLLIDGKREITYDRIEKIDKTYFKNKGYFVLVYKNSQGSEVDKKLSSRKYDNLEAVLEHLVVKIS